MLMQATLILAFLHTIAFDIQTLNFSVRKHNYLCFNTLNVIFQYYSEKVRDVSRNLNTNYVNCYHEGTHTQTVLGHIHMESRRLP